MSDQQNDQVDSKIVEISNEIGKVLEKGDIKVGIVILENPSAKSNNDKIFVYVTGHRYDATRLCCAVANQLKSQISSELEGQS